jgi:hypothetical protein
MFHLRELDQGQHFFAPFQVPADTAADGRKPRTKSFGLLELIQVPICTEERLD